MGCGIWRSAGHRGEYKRLEGVTALGGFVHGFSTRLGGFSLPPYNSLNLGSSSGDNLADVERNRHHFLSTIGCQNTPVQTLKQVHSTDIILIGTDHSVPDTPMPGDALVTDRCNLLVGIFTADCYPILLADYQRKVIAAVHAGWRGAAGGIISRAIDAMKNGWGCQPASLIALIGAGIGPCCYQVGQEVYRSFTDEQPEGRDWFRPDRCPNPRLGPTWRLDLLAAITAQLRQSGLAEGDIHALDECTSCHPELYFSYRRDGAATGRMLSVIGIAAS
jgi:YfiH family protein